MCACIYALKICITALPNAYVGQKCAFTQISLCSRGCRYRQRKLDRRQRTKHSVLEEHAEEEFSSFENKTIVCACEYVGFIHKERIGRKIVSMNVHNML